MTTEKHLVGQPRKFTPIELEEKFQGYIKNCIEDNKLANITGFCVYAGIHKDTYYNYKGNDRLKGEYADSIKRIEDTLEEFSIQAAYNVKNPAFLIFYMKNKFGWVDKQEVSTEINGNINNPLKDLSTEEIKKLLDK